MKKKGEKKETKYSRILKSKQQQKTGNLFNIYLYNLTCSHMLFDMQLCKYLSNKL